MSSDTPRTDAAILDVLQSGQHYKVKADFARQLERELIAAIETIKCLLMKATIEFTLPEEDYEHRQTVNAREAWIALQELDEEMRRIVKHGLQPSDPKKVELLAARIRDVYTIPTLSILES